MPALRNLLLLTLTAALLFQAALARADDPPKPREFKEDDLALARKVVGMLDGEQQLLVNGLRYLLRPKAEIELMEGRLYQNPPMPSLGEERKGEMPLPECMRLWALLDAGMPVSEDLRRELQMFIDSDHKRYEKSLAGYAVPMAVCTAALRRPELENAEALSKKAKALMEAGMRVRDLTAEESPCIKGTYIEPMWYANHLWRAVMCRCALELKIKFNENIWESELKNLSHAAQDELGWISTFGKNRTAENDLNTNLLALATISLALGAPQGTLKKSVVSSLEKRLKFQQQVLARLEADWPDEPLVGSRLALIMTFNPEYAPENRSGDDWRFALRRNAVDAMMASGAIYAQHSLTHDMGLDGLLSPGLARTPAETALACLAVSGGMFRQDESPLRVMNEKDFELAVQSLGLLHASVAPPLPEGGNLALLVEEAINQGAAWLEKQQAPDGSFGNQRSRGSPAYCAVALHALMHAGYEPEHKVIQKGIEWLLNNVPNALRAGPNEQLMMTAYDAGIILMMFQRYYEKQQVEHGVFQTENPKAAQNARAAVRNTMRQDHRNLIQSLVDYLDDCYVGGNQGGWNYSPVANKGVGHSDNSISQFAGCGYKCATLLGATVDLKVFETEARTLIAQYRPDPKMKKIRFERYPAPANGNQAADTTADEVPERYAKGGTYAPPEWDGSIQPGAWLYRRGKLDQKNGAVGAIQYTGAAMALLTAARDELWVAKALPLDLHRQIDLHIFGGQAWMAAHPYWQNEIPDDSEIGAEEEEPQGQNKRGGAGWGNIYNFYAIERGCVMAEYDLLGGKVDWYRHLAYTLVRQQQGIRIESQKGSWGDALNTSWAILILRRAAPPSVTRPPRQPDPLKPDPKPVQQPKFPITPGPVKRNKAEPQPETQPEPTKPEGPVTGK
ncbi:MAG: hypothetical protein ICCCNLDF_03398 [Planctomycetes bacterium]|nr:hypothetical protein [Planctomycetota bacterium]